MTLSGAFRILQTLIFPLKTGESVVETTLSTIVTATGSATVDLPVLPEKALTTATTLVLQVTRVYKITRNATVLAGTGPTVVVRHRRRHQGTNGCYGRLPRHPRPRLPREGATLVFVHLRPQGATATALLLVAAATVALAVAFPCAWAAAASVTHHEAAAAPLLLWQAPWTVVACTTRTAAAAAAAHLDLRLQHCLTLEEANANHLCLRHATSAEVEVEVEATKGLAMSEATTNGIPDGIVE